VQQHLGVEVRGLERALQADLGQHSGRRRGDLRRPPGRVRGTTLKKELSTIRTSVMRHDVAYDSIKTVDLI
jgi:hypothetical protein